MLYVLLGVALAMVASARGAPGRGIAVAAFVVQFVVNVSWSPVFFAMHQMSMALGLIAVMIALTVVVIALFWRIRPVAGALMLPYLAWICFAALLNYQFLSLNPAADGAQGTTATVRVQL